MLALEFWTYNITDDVYYVVGPLMYNGLYIILSIEVGASI
jgi:hypothetical protein